MYNLEAILLDLDGVLVDTIPILKRSYIDTADHIQATVPTQEQLNEAVRMPPKAALLYLFDDNSYHILSIFDRYWRINLGMASPFRGVPQLLGELSRLDIKIGTVTSRNNSDTSTCLNASGIYVYMDIIITWGHYRVAKPSPVCLLVASEQIGIPLSKIAYVGDQIVDVQAAKNAGAVAVGAVWDPNAKEDELRRAGADVIVREPKEIIKLILL